MTIKFTHTHGSVWLIWVAVIFSIGLIIFFFGVWPNFLIILESFGFENNVISKNAFFWFLISIWILLCLRGAKITYEYKGEHDDS